MKPALGLLEKCILYLLSLYCFLLNFSIESWSVFKIYNTL